MLGRDRLLSIQSFYNKYKHSEHIHQEQLQSPSMIPVVNIAPHYLYTLKQVISVTQQDYQQLYAQPLQQAARFLQDKSDILEAVLKQMIITLKIRRAYMLPVGTDAETCYQQQDAWTYALFTAVLLKEFRQNTTDLTAKINQWLPDAGIAWLKKYAALYKAWLDFLQNKSDAANRIAFIIYQAEDALAGMMTPLRQENDVGESSFPAQNIMTEKAETVPNTPETIEQATPTPSVEPTQNTSSSAEIFIRWIKRSIARNQLSINQLDSWLYRAEEGILLVMPDLYHAFLHTHPDFQAINADKNDEELVDELTTQRLFIKASDNTGFIHHYHVGKWDDRELRKGLLIAPQQLFAENTLPPVHEALAIEQI